FDPSSSVSGKEQGIHPLVDPADVVFGEHPAGNAALVADGDHQVPHRTCPSDGIGCPGNELHTIGVTEIAVIDNEGIVAVEEDGRSFHLGCWFRVWTAGPAVIMKGDWIWFNGATWLT